MKKRWFTHVNLLFSLSSILIICHITPIPIHLDEYTISLLGIMYIYCFLETAQVKYFTAKMGKEGAELTVGNKEE